MEAKEVLHQRENLRVSQFWDQKEKIWTTIFWNE